ncbi:single-stranded DNA-binding protein [Klebsiella sp. D-Nf1]|nr:single-stranded DNA-binding protein [Klebsiella sp. C-Nf10]PJX50987.1 single-stranded DNA-binding protein [Klebsiella sp. D-Nf1]RVR00333.1 single-stranded DNA-binding protein [Klebsiella pneumoniae]
MKVISRGQVQQVPAKRQNRGPGNSTGDGFNRQKTRQRRNDDGA